MIARTIQMAYAHSSNSFKVCFFPIALKASFTATSKDLPSVNAFSKALLKAGDKASCNPDFSATSIISFKVFFWF